jgi:hypothetical protein
MPVEGRSGARLEPDSNVSSARAEAAVIDTVAPQTWPAVDAWSSRHVGITTPSFRTPSPLDPGLVESSLALHAKARDDSRPRSRPLDVVVHGIAPGASAITDQPKFAGVGVATAS